MKNLNNISVFKLILLSILANIIDNIYVYIIVLIYLYLDNHLNCLFYILLIIFLKLISLINVDFINIGIVDYKYNSYYLVDKFFYKVKLITSDDLLPGDILFMNNFNINTYQNELKKHILFYGNEYEKIGNFLIRNIIYQRVDSFNDLTKNVLYKYLYNFNNYYEEGFNLSYGLVIYYLFSWLYKRNKKISLFLMSCYTLSFCFQLKFFLLIIDYMLSLKNINKLDKYALKILILFILNKYLLLNYSILIPLLINLFNLIEFKIDFKTYFALTESILFGEIKIIQSLFYKYYIYIQLLILFLCFILLLNPNIEQIFLKIINIYSKFNNYDLSVRGRISILSFIVFIYLKNLIKYDHYYLGYLLFLIILCSPLNNCLYHLSFIDVGQGDATLLYIPFTRNTILIDTGSQSNYYQLKKYLFKQGIYKIDYLIITHNDSDHNGNIDNLKKDFKIGEIVKEGKDIEFKDIKYKFYYLGNYDNDNDNSLVYGTNINGLSFLFTGDISSNIEKIFVKEYGPIQFDVLKVSHHGSSSATSSYFIGNILPKYAIISTNGKYGHPASSTIETLDSYLVNTYITKQAGDLEFYFLKGFNVLKAGSHNFVIMK